MPFKLHEMGNDKAKGMNDSESGSDSGDEV